MTQRIHTYEKIKIMAKKEKLKKLKINKTLLAARLDRVFKNNPKLDFVWVGNESKIFSGTELGKKAMELSKIDCEVYKSSKIKKEK